jgi:hypothetical protein
MAALRLLGAPYDLTYGSDSIDDRRSRWVGQKGCERLGKSDKLSLPRDVGGIRGGREPLAIVPCPFMQSRPRFWQNEPNAGDF